MNREVPAPFCEGPEGKFLWSTHHETFNTLKNQGYEFEHNYGHGKKNLSTIMAMLMLLAFLVDQVQLLCCQQYKKAKSAVGTFRSLWENMRAISRLIAVKSWEMLYQCIIGEIRVDTS